MKRVEDFTSRHVTSRQKIVPLFMTKMSTYSLHLKMAMIRMILSQKKNDVAVEKTSNVLNGILYFHKIHS